MGWLCVNKNGQELICQNKPERLGLLKRRPSDCGAYKIIDDIWSEPLSYWGDNEMCSCQDATYNFDIDLPKGSIEKLIGKTLTWDDEAVEYK